MQTPLKHSAIRFLLRKNLALKPGDPDVSGEPRIWRKIRLQTTLRKKLLTIKPFVNGDLGQQHAVTSQPLNHQTVPPNQNILPQVERILYPDRFHSREDSRL